MEKEYKENHDFLEAEGLTMHFPAKRDSLGRPVSWIHAADDVSFDTSLSEMDERADELGFKSSLHTLGKKREGDSFRKAVESYEGNLALVRSSLRGEIDRIAQTRSGLLDELRLLAPRIQILESHEKDFPAGVSKLYRLLKERFQLDSEFALNPLCDCLELVDEDWGEAIETLLVNRRFDCFLPQKFYGEAQKVLAQNPDLRLEGSSGIVDTATLEGSPFKVDGSLADKIRCAVDASGGDELPLVRDYVDFLLGDIKAVEEPAGRGEFKWITKDGLYYDGASVRYLIREKDFTPYLGKEAIARQLKEMKERYRDLSERIRELDEEKAPLEEKLSRSLALDPMSLRSLPRHWAEEEDALRKKAELEDRVRALEESMAAEDLTVFNTALEALDERERGLKAELEALFAERDAIAEERGRHNLALEQATNDYQEGKKGYDLFLMDHSDPLLLELAEHKLQEYGKNPYPRIQAAREENHRALLESERKIVRIMGGYNDKFQQNDVEPVLENLPLYIERYQKIVKDSLVTARSRAEQASITAAENFKTGFLVGLRSNIEQASLQIEKLNRTLRKHPFGSARSIYRFLVKPTGDPELRKIYDMDPGEREPRRVERRDDRALLRLPELPELRHRRDDPGRAGEALQRQRARTLRRRDPDPLLRPHCRELRQCLRAEEERWLLALRDRDARRGVQQHGLRPHRGHDGVLPLPRHPAPRLRADLALQLPRRPHRQYPRPRQPEREAHLLPGRAHPEGGRGGDGRRIAIF